MTPAELSSLTGQGETPYTRTNESEDFSNLDWDEPESWYYPETLGNRNIDPQLRPQVRVLRIIDRKGKPTGKLVYAKNEVQYAALRQEQRDAKGNVYIPAAELVDVIYDDEK